MLADPPAAPGSQQAPSEPARPGAPAPAAPELSAHNCSECGSPLQPGQDWCLQCGTGARDSLRSRTPSWRSAAAILSTLVVLIAGAATAAYAALSKSSGKSQVAVTAVAQVAPPVTSTPVVPPASETPATATAKIGTPTTIKPLPLTPVKAPKIQAITPVPKLTKATPLPTGTGQGKTTPKAGNEGPAIAGEANAEALLLDTNAASTYNPYNYTPANFGDPSLAIDGDNSTGWTAVVEPTVAPKMAEGVLIDLNTARKIAVMGLSTTTPGLTVQVYGANAAAPPASITDPAWVALTPSRVINKKHVRLKLGTSTPASKGAHRFIVLWLSAAPASAVGTPQAPGRVSVNEIALFPRKK